MSKTIYINDNCYILEVNNIQVDINLNKHTFKIYLINNNQNTIVQFSRLESVDLRYMYTENMTIHLSEKHLIDLIDKVYDKGFIDKGIHSDLKSCIQYINE